MPWFLTKWVLKASANEEALLRKQNCVLDAIKVFGKFHKHFLLSRRRFCDFYGVFKKMYPLGDLAIAI